MAIKGDEQYWKKFNLMNLKGKPYLTVANRLVALRDLDPTASIVTECIKVDLTTNFAFFKATITLSDGTVATGHGSETAKDFGDFIEKAETKAIGRALAAVGIGVQYAADEDFSFEGRKLETARTDFPGVDSPVEPARPAPKATRTVSPEVVVSGPPEETLEDQIALIKIEDLDEVFKREVARVGGGQLQQASVKLFGEGKTSWTSLDNDQRIRLMAYSTKHLKDFVKPSAKIDQELASAQE